MLLGGCVVRDVWATYSVTDHLSPRAFVADVMLYDKLVIPVPDQDDLARWETQGWDAGRQESLLAILGDRAVPVVWDAAWRTAWQSRWNEAKNLENKTSLDAMAITADTLRGRVPRSATGVIAVASYTSVDDLRADLRAAPNPNGTPGIGGLNVPGQLAAVIGREFLVPDDPQLNHEDLLRAALHLSGDQRFRRRRAAYWRWQQEFLQGIVLDQAAVAEAVDQMNDLIEDEKEELRRSRIKLGVSFAFAVGSATTGMLAAPIAPVAMAGAFLSVGAWVIDHGVEILGEPRTPGPAAMCLAAQREFGWGGRR